MKPPLRLRAVFSDKVNHAQKKIYQAEIHLVADWDEPLDRPRLKRALRLVLDAEPVLGCRFRDSWFRPFWERLDEKALDEAEILSEPGPESDVEAASQAFYAQIMDPSAGPQLRVLILSLKGGGDRLILKISHLTCDAGGLKAVFYRLGEIYSALSANPDHAPSPATGTRSMSQVYFRFPVREWLAIFWSGLVNMWRMVAPFRSYQFPSGMVEKPPLVFVFRHLSRERVSAFSGYARMRGATLNDLLTAALFRAFAALEGGKVKGKLRVASTVDLRRYLPGRRTGALCQVSGLWAVGIDYRPGEDFAATLASVKRSVDPQKERYFGLGMMIGFWLMGVGQPYFLPKFTMRNTFALGVRDGNLPPAFTNMGPIERESCRAWGKAPASAFLGVPTARPPWFAVGMSGYDGSLSLSAGFYPSAIAPERIEALFDGIEAELNAAMDKAGQ
ncbi:MAG: hypothetical protein HZB23_02385 [Deltaproteobacteria bacterium]|nr:hypothetical protein [Deltaproteobacteria bacterium]